MPGKYGPYVKWAKVNATLPKEVTPEAVTLEEALALIAEKAGQGGQEGPGEEGRAKEGACEGTGKPAAAKKPAAKKAPAKQLQSLRRKRKWPERRNRGGG